MTKNEIRLLIKRLDLLQQQIERDRENLQLPPNHPRSLPLMLASDSAGDLITDLDDILTRYDHIYKGTPQPHEQGDNSVTTTPQPVEDPFDQTDFE